MRDPNRIPEILRSLERTWKTCPDLRLGQLISVAAQDKDIFNIEDDLMKEKLAEFTKESIDLTPIPFVSFEVCGEDREWLSLHLIVTSYLRDNLGLEKNDVFVFSGDPERRWISVRFGVLQNNRERLIRAVFFVQKALKLVVQARSFPCRDSDGFTRAELLSLPAINSQYYSEYQHLVGVSRKYG